MGEDACIRPRNLHPASEEMTTGYNCQAIPTQLTYPF